MRQRALHLQAEAYQLGKYTRQALMNLGILDKVDDASTITTEQVSEALGGAEISEQANVSKVLIAVTEGACEVGTTYYSDTYGYEDQIKILQTVSYDLTGKRDLSDLPCGKIKRQMMQSKKSSR